MHFFCKSKLHKLTVTKANLHYEGSLTLDESLLEAADIRPGEKIEVLNINNGTRIETYVIKGRRGSGVVCLNGPAARSGCVGDKIIVLCYVLLEDDEMDQARMKVVTVDERNKIKTTLLRR